MLLIIPLKSESSILLKPVAPIFMMLKILSAHGVFSLYEALPPPINAQYRSINTFFPQFKTWKTTYFPSAKTTTQYCPFFFRTSSIILILGLVSIC